MKRLAFALPALLPGFAPAAEAENKGMPQLDPSTYGNQLFWLAAFFVLFYGFMRWYAMPRIERILAERQTRISGDIGKATADSTAARTLQSEVEASTAAARDKARGLTLEADAASRAALAKRDAELSQEINQRIDNAEARIAASRAAAMGTIDQIAAGLVAEIVPKLTGMDVADADALSAVRKVEA